MQPASCARPSISTDTSNSAQQCTVDQGLTSGKDDTPVPQSRKKSKEDIESSIQTSVTGQRARKTFPVGNKNTPKHAGSSATSTAGSTEPKQAQVPHMVNIPNPLPTSLGNGFKADFKITGSRVAMAEPGIIGPAVSILMVSNTGSSNGCTVTPVPTTPTTSAVPSPTPVPPATGALDSPIASTKVEQQYGALSERLPSGTDVIGGTDVESLANLRPPPLQAKPTAAPIPGNTGEVMAVSQSRSAPTVSNLVVQASARMADYCQRLLEDMLTEFASQGSLEAKVAQLHLKLENAEKRHQVEQARLTEEHGMQLEEQRLKLEREKDAAMREVRQNAAAEKDRAVALAKKTQWCKRCPKEAMYYCCWNTSYCHPECQQSDWSSHQKVCTQVQNRAERPVVASGSTVASGSPDNSGASSTDVIVLDDSPVRAGSAGRKRPSARVSPSAGAKARIIPRSTFNGPITYPKPIQITTDVVGNATETGERRHVSSVSVLPSSSGPVNTTAVRITMPANRPLPPVIAPRRSTSQQTAERPKSNSMHGTTHNNPYVPT
ncbi:MYND-type zinc finger-containing chromatin reader Zmynd8-like [Anopheles bellator]|uniref:MYND-type zinc finger-containing chromatin reader Zmynd8-like n=1 Tax=Anopheles bellator TaxID=139047 RepID=UPI0026480BA8|nr:MYND-type zinc finger-containing chromatin reader Zmynd8-like [Anopheles bellator]